MILATSIFSRLGLAFTSRWLHILFGIMWIGLLYYFNFVQVPAFAKFGNEGDGPRARNIAIDKLASKALWYFRWSALLTFINIGRFIVTLKPIQIGLLFVSQAVGVFLALAVLAVLLPMPPV